MSNAACSVFWFRRDLRLEDNRGLFQALASGPILPIFIFDSEILEKLPRADARVEFIRDRLELIDAELKKHDSSLAVYHGSPEKIWAEIFKKYKIKTIFTNEDYEPYARERDEKVAELARKHGAEFIAVKDQVIFAKGEVTKDDGKPYQVYSAYARKWRKAFGPKDVKPHASEKNLKALLKNHGGPKLPSLKTLGFEKRGEEFPADHAPDSLIKNYKDTRDLMGEDGTSRLGMHLRFGTISIRKLAAHAHKLSDTYFGELIWREFFMQILWHFPESATRCFDERYEQIEWINNKTQFKKWCEGKTGYPIVDAGMRQLNETGFIHNRARMVVASFLSKHLLIDWKWGEKYFAEKLLDYEMSSNVGNWQWAAGCGCDAAPYFRVFNPTLQAKRFDKQGKYVKRWVGDDLGTPMIDHDMARKRAIATYRKALGKKK